MRVWSPSLEPRTRWGDPTHGFIMSPSRGTNGEATWSSCSARVVADLKTRHLQKLVVEMFWCDGGACVSSDPSFQQSTDGPIGDVTTWSEWKSSECRSGCTQRGRGARERRRTCPATAKCEGSAYDVALCDDVKVCGKKTRVTANELAARKCTEYAALECGWAVPYSAAAQPAVASTRHESSSMTLVWSPTSRTARGATSTVLPTTTACSIIAYLRISR
ncbi:unnamed protein product [Leptidea sinapis]|uniref:ADAMTS cysteine-rich domain-containing protein n=1 Tax=Leptidea sinapis TaxID=189913 RepID=A0A5E4PZQ6_9NEOP|nr:unnamed protein product [Leptidea sinapis]